MKKLPIKYLQIALVALIKDAGYDTDGFDVFPRVEVSGVEMEEGAEKGYRDYNCTFLLDVITKSDSPMLSLNILENLRNKLDELEVDFFYKDGLIPETCTQAIELTDTETIYRQLQRFRIHLTQKD
ncbi:hypothetical protein [Alistipes indistinctus]|jgi:hypothetical protein|uniref:hypothetical protein n=1 Tax=Alistipes indistinctus TaxID=626932 RepID=UPI0036F43150